MSIWRTTVQMEYGGGGPGVNVWEYRAVGDGPDPVPGDPAFQGAIDALNACYQQWKTLMTTDVTIRSDGVFTKIDQTNPTQEQYTGWVTTGTSSPSNAPFELAMICNLKTGTASRRARGRKFVGPLAQNVIQENGSPVETKRQTVLDGLQEILDFNQGTNNGAFVVYSTVGSIGRDILRGDCPNHFGVLRSRRNPS